MASLSDLPDELLLSVISLLPADDAVVFGWIDRRCRYLASDNTFWRNQIRADLEVPRAIEPLVSIPPWTLPLGHMRALYYRLRYPRAFVWGFWGTGDELNAGALRSALRCPMPEGEAWRGFEHVVEMRNMDSYRVITRDSRGTLASWTAAKTTQAFGVCAPHTLPGLAARDAWAVSASGVVFVAPDGNVYESTLCNNEFGTPRLIDLAGAGATAPIRQLVAGTDNAAAALLQDGSMYAWMSEQAPLRVNARPVLTEWQQNYWDSYTAYARGTGVWTPQERAVERPDEIVRIALNDCALVLLKRSGEVWRSHVPIYRNSPPDVFDMSLSHPGNFDLVCQNGRFAVTRDGATWLLDGQYRDEVGTAWAPSASGSHTTSLAMWDYTTTLHANGAVYSQLNPWWFRGNAGAGLDKDLAQPQRWRVAFPPDAMGGETQVFGIDGACALALGDGRSRLPRERWSAGACVQHVPAPVSVSEHGYNLRSRCM